jgi:hypothetical protein
MRHQNFAGLSIIGELIPNSRTAVSATSQEKVGLFTFLLLSHDASPILSITMVKNPPVKQQSEPTLPTTEDRSPNRSLPKPRQTAWQSARSHLGNEISLSHADIPIIACCLVSGLCDSSAYNAWSCFVSMQTGLSSPPLPHFPHSRLDSQPLLQVTQSSSPSAPPASQPATPMAGSNPSSASPASYAAASASPRPDS